MSKPLREVIPQPVNIIGVHAHQVFGQQRLAVPLGAGENGLVIMACTDMVPELVFPGEGVVALQDSALKTPFLFVRFLVTVRVILLLVRQ